MSEFEKYFKVTLCPGCVHCVQQLPNGQQVKNEHVLSQEDVTNSIKAYKFKAGVTSADVQDVAVKGQNGN